LISRLAALAQVFMLGQCQSGLEGCATHLARILRLAVAVRALVPAQVGELGVSL